MGGIVACLIVAAALGVPGPWKVRRTPNWDRMYRRLDDLARRKQFSALADTYEAGYVLEAADGRRLTRDKVMAAMRERFQPVVVISSRDRASGEVQVRWYRRAGPAMEFGVDFWRRFHYTWRRVRTRVRPAPARYGLAKT